MKRVKKPPIRSFSVGAVLSMLGLSWLASRLLRLSRGSTLIFMAVMLILALVVGYLVYRMLSRSAAKKKGAQGGTAASTSVRDLDTLWSKAKKRLAASKTEGSKIARRPMVILLGPERSTKTTLVEQSGLAAEHLAGELYRGETIAPTERANVWYGPDGTVFVEVGGPLLEEASAWRRLLKHARPQRLNAVFGRGRQAPRAVVVCYPCDRLADAAETETRVRELRERLLELSGELGTRVPVYVVFTKFDKIPYFQAFARNLQPGEVTQVFGTTLPLSEAFGGVDYEQRESRRVLTTFDGLIGSLTSRRADLLGREGDEGTRQDLYEFAREFAKLRERVATFLLDLCRPSRLAVSPFLRGYYFTGVRPVELNEVAPAPAQPAAAGQPGPTDASRIFDVGRQQAQMAAVGGRRRVPEWVFVRDLFARIFSGDRAAREVTGGGAQVNLLRRAGVIALVSAIGIFIAGMTVSFVRNRALATDVRTAVEGVESLASFSGSEASSSDLARMDALRDVLDRIRGYREEGPPLSMRWGLYRGDRLFADARQGYFAVFDRALGDDTKERLQAYLAALPETPPEGADPAESYNALRAYVQLTVEPDSAADGDLPGVLTRFWGSGSDSTHQALAERQFAFFAQELRLGDPTGLEEPAEPGLIDRGRQYQSGFSDADHLYRSLLAGAGVDDVRFSSPGAVTVGSTVEGAFTAAGWQYVQDRLNSLDLSGKPYVVGDATLSSREARELAEQFREQYTADFIEAWTAFLASANVSNFNLPGAAPVLDRLRAGDSPLLELFALVNRNTVVDSGRVRAAFQPIHHLMPADTSGGSQLTGDQNQPYVSSLDNLWSSMSEYARAQTDEERRPVLEEATGQADRVLTAVADVARGFEQSGGGARVGSEVTRLLRRPAVRIQELAPAFLANIGRSGPNSAGEQFCADVGAVFDKYPFSTAAGTGATADELSSVFHPTSGLLKTLEDDLDGIVRRAGPVFRAASSDGPQPTDAFLGFMTRALAIQTQLYRAGDQPRVDFTLAVDVSGSMERVVVNIGGARMEVTSNVRRTRQFTWNPASAQTASIAVTVEGSERELAFEGSWAVQRLFGQATRDDLGGGRYELIWTIPGAAEPVIGELQLPSGALILDPRVFAGLGRCPSPVVR